MSASLARVTPRGGGDDGGPGRSPEPRPVRRGGDAEAPHPAPGRPRRRGGRRRARPRLAPRSVRRRRGGGCAPAGRNRCRRDGRRARTPPPPPAGGGEIDRVTWALTGDAPAIDYAKAYDFNTNGVVTNITEPLLRMNPEGVLEPNLAEDWELKDPTTLVIKLRSGVQFHDGTEMTAEDVAFSMNRHRDPDLGSYLATFHDRVKSVDATGDRKS